MGIFNPKENKATKDDYIKKYDIGNLSNQEVIEKIAERMAATITKDTLSDKSKIQIFSEISYLETLVEQNWLILKQLEKLNNK